MFAAKTMRNSLILGIVFAVVLLVVLSVFLIIIRKQFLKTKQQKSLIEIKQKDITDSINYAKRLQNAILPNINSLTNFQLENFILYLPKGILSGDFYWIEKYDGKI